MRRSPGSGGARWPRGSPLSGSCDPRGEPGGTLLPSAPRAPVPWRDWVSPFHGERGLGSLGRAGGRDLHLGMCLGGCVWVPAYPDRGEKVRFHFLPFPQEGTHTPLNLTPAAAASRPGVSDRPHWLPPPPHGPGPGILSLGRGLRCGSLGSGTLAPRVPGIQAVRQPLTLVREASRPAGAQGPAAAAAAARSSWVSSLPPPALRRLLLGRPGALARPDPGRASWGGGRQGCRRALRRLCRRPGSQLCGRRPRGSLDHLFHPSPGIEPPPLPPPARGGGSPACICRRGGSGRRLAWLRPPQPGSPPQATRFSLSPAWLPPSLLPHGSRDGPRPSLPCIPLPSFSLPTPLLCAPGSGAGPVTSNPVWRRRDWPARAIKRATSSFPITHCQSGNRGGPAGN